MSNYNGNEIAVRMMAPSHACLIFNIRTGEHDLPNSGSFPNLEMTAASSPVTTLGTFMRHARGLGKCHFCLTELFLWETESTSDLEAGGSCHLEGYLELLEALAVASEPLPVGPDSQRHADAFLWEWVKWNERRTWITGKWGCATPVKGP